MRYFFATVDSKVQSKLPQGSMLIVFEASEQGLAHIVVRQLADALESEELREIAQFLRTEHEKSEEN